MKLITALSVYIAFLALCAEVAPIDVPVASFKAKFFSIEYQYPLISCNKTTSTSEGSKVSLAQYLLPPIKSTPTTEEPINVASTTKSAFPSQKSTPTTEEPINVVSTTKSTFPSQKTTDSSVKYSYSSVSTDNIPVTILKTIKKETSCANIFLQGYNLSGVYEIFPPSMYEADPFLVFCDMQTNGGGWTVIQRRGDYEPLENFTRNWNEYKNGFGQLDRDFWLGNDHLFFLTNQENVELRVDLEDFKKNKKWAQYSQFRIQDEKNSYELSISGYKGNAGDSLDWHNKTEFSTYDRDTSFKCANRCKGGWWYRTFYCWYSNLNGFYFKTNAPDIYQGTVWNAWINSEYSLKKTEMKIRPANFLST